MQCLLNVLKDPQRKENHNVASKLKGILDTPSLTYCAVQDPLKHISGNALLFGTFLQNVCIYPEMKKQLSIFLHEVMNSAKMRHLYSMAEATWNKQVPTESD